MIRQEDFFVWATDAEGVHCLPSHETLITGYPPKFFHDVP
jgi:hypothetical protein